ncbi:MAG: beta-galactosidase trimerization domain-containing protein [Acidobacteria bacterium]|nr:beta-galactosidase trimerization domain-containing protein [Acidobacteriota bacterium]MBI3656071.1 beta-galactosidase trimerization domain-containing protein [Acidobacteriota bacterium]
MKNVAPASAPLAVASDRQSWSQYKSFLWLHDKCERTDDLGRALPLLGITGVNVYDHQPGSAWAARHGLSFYVDNLAGKGDLYLNRTEWQQAWDRYWTTRDPAHFVRPRCLSDPTVLKSLKDKIRQGIAMHKAHRPLAYALDDEISITAFANPFDFCFSSFCIPRFQTWLKRVYTDLAALNRAWETSFAAWENVRPLTTDALRRREFARGPESYNFAPWMDHRTFMDDVLAATLQELISFSHQLDPVTPVGFTGGQAPSAFGGYDWWKLMQAVEFLEPYDLGGSREIIRSFNTRAIPIVQTLFVSAAKRTEMLWRLWYYLAHGDRGVILWSSDEYFQNNNPQAPTEAARMLTATLCELAGLRVVQELSQGRLETGGIAIFYSQPSLQAHWMLDSKEDGDTWPKRFSSFEYSHSSILRTMQAWQKLLEDTGYQYDYLSAQQIRAGALQLPQYRVLILPKTIALSEAEATAIEQFVRRGGVAIADYQLGLMDEHGRSRPTGALDALFGIHRADRRVNERYGDIDPLQRLRAGQFKSLPIMEPGLSADRAGPIAKVRGVPCALIHKVGRGTAIYLNLGLLQYATARFEQAAGGEIRQWFQGLLQEAGLAPAVKVTHAGKDLAYCERLLYRVGDRRYLFVVMNKHDINDPGKPVELGSTPLSITLHFNQPVRLTNVRTGKTYGHGVTFSDSFISYEANIYELTP